MEDSSPSTRDIRRDQIGQTAWQRWLRFFKSQHSAHRTTTGCLNGLRLHPASWLRFFKSHVSAQGMVSRCVKSPAPSELGFVLSNDDIWTPDCVPLTPSTVL